MTSFVGEVPTAGEGSPDAPTGDTCPYCLAALTGESRRCGTCRASHHFDCWRENDGCATLGCDGGHTGPVANDEPVQPVPPLASPWGPPFQPSGSTWNQPTAAPLPGQPFELPSSAAPRAFGPSGAKVLDALRSGWKAALLPAAQLYGGLVALALILTGAVALFTGAEFGDFSFLTVVKAAGLAVAMAFRGALRFEVDGDAAFSVVAAPLALLIVALGGVWFMARRAGARHADADAEAWPLGLRFALSFTALAGLGALAARTSEEILSGSDFTLRATVIRTLIGTLLFTFPVATLAILSAQGRLSALRENAAAKLGSWARPVSAAVALGGAQLAAALVVSAVWGVWVLARADMSMTERVGVAVFGLLYLPTLALWGLGLALGASLEIDAIGGSEKIGWLTAENPTFIWLVGGAIALAMAVRAAIWLGRRSRGASNAWAAQFAIATSGLWLGGAVLSRATMTSETDASGSLGLVLVEAPLAGLAMGLVASAIAMLIVARRPADENDPAQAREMAVLTGLWAATQRNRKRVVAGFAVAAILLGGGAGAVMLLSRPPGPFMLEGTVVVDGDYLDDDDTLDRLRTAYRAAHPEEAAAAPSYQPTPPSRPTEPTDTTSYLYKPTQPTKRSTYFSKPTKAEYTYGTYFSQEGYDYAMRLYNEDQQEINKEYAQDMEEYRAEMAEYNEEVGGYNAKVAAYEKALTTYDADYAKYLADDAAWDAFTQKVLEAAQNGLTADCPSFASSYYSSIRDGADVDIADEESEVLATAKLRNGRVHMTKSGQTSCTFEFGIEVPHRSKYRVTVADQRTEHFDVNDVKDKKVEVSLG